MEIFKINPSVWVFHEALENPQEVIDFFEENYEWKDWYHFGKIHDIQLNSDNNFFDSFPTEEEWKEKIFNPSIYTEKEAKIVKRILEAFYKTTKTFLEENNKVIEKPSFSSFDIGKYFPGGRMTYHTDHEQHKYFLPGPKFHTTAVFYPNDNYTGGEISFLEVDDNQEILWVYDYKPKAGDVVVFSSMHPIYHAVKELQTGTKYIIRTYWRSNQTPTEEWNKGILEHGEEKWMEMQLEESLRIRDGNYIYKFFDGKEYVIQYLDRKKYGK